MTDLEQRIVDLLQQGPMTADELCGTLQRNSLWTTLGMLRDRGIVSIAYVTLRGRGNGSGRGKAIYQLAQGSAEAIK